MKMTHVLNKSIVLEHEGQQLLEYVYRPETPVSEAPRPYIHPLRTLSGNLVTGFRPHEAPWYHGLSMVLAHVNEQTFFGGISYVADVGDGTPGYRQLPNTGQQVHKAWQEASCDGDSAHLRESLTWVTYDGTEWLAEDRDIVFGGIDASAGAWTITWGSTLTNISGTQLRLGSGAMGRPAEKAYKLAISPIREHSRSLDVTSATSPVPAGGYGGGLYWRGPRSFVYGDVFGADGLGGRGAGDETLMGVKSPWVAYKGWHDEVVDACSTLAFLDHPENPRHPTQWFVRNGVVPAHSFAGVGFSFDFDEEYVMEPGEKMELRYRVVIADGTLTPELVETYSSQYVGV